MPLEREWVTIVDPEDDHRRYTFDVSFLLSNYRCIYGDGCPGTAPDGDPALGCCNHGAYLTDEERPERYERWLADLSPETMQFHRKAVKGGAFREDDEEELHTRVVDRACIFLNRAGFGGGEGCALHLLAEREDLRPMDVKPQVCWQVPLHRTISEETANDGGDLEVHTIAAFERGTWGPGGADFAWWCTEEPEPFSADGPVYRTMEDELRAMVGDPIYDELAAFLARRSRQRHRVRFLPLAR